MSYTYKLPKNKEDASEAIAHIVSEGRSKRNPESVKWFIAQYYMSGLREFTKIDYTSGTVTVSYLNEPGILKLRYEDIVAKYTTQLGRLLAIDISPKVSKKGVSLDGVRKSSVGQVVLDEAMPQDKVDKLKLDMAPPILMYGTIGLGLWVEGPDSHGVEVIMPWELLPIPIDISGPTDVRGIIRMRYVPLDWLKNLAITPKGSKSYIGLNDMEIPSGEMPLDMNSWGDGMMAQAANGGGFFVKNTTKDDGMASGSKKTQNLKNVPITMLVEVWTETSDGYLAEYGVYAGMTKFKELYRYDHTSGKYPMPTRIVRGTTVGSFWGRSFVDQMIPLNNELEMALSSVFQSVADFDLYGLQMWPTTLGTPPQAHRGQDGIKRITYEVDYTCPDQKPFNIEPAKMTAPQLKALEVASALMDKIANQPAGLTRGEAPGRVDSGPAMGMLMEASSIPLSPVAKNIAMAMSGEYRALLRILKDNWTDQKVVSITNLDDSLAGIVLDTDSGTMTLSQNAIPYPDEVLVTIMSERPVSIEQQKVELKEAYKEGRITLDEFNFEVRKRGLDIPVGDEIGWQNYRRAMLENIVLFGDGKTPGEGVIVGPADLHRIHLMVLQSFVARPEFFVASQEVRDKFYKHIDEHKAQMGDFPDQLPYPEETAEASLGMMGGEGGMSQLPMQ